MRQAVEMMTSMQMLGFVMKTGACPQEGDIKNMVKASVTALRECANVAEEVVKIERDADAKAHGRPR